MARLTGRDENGNGVCGINVPCTCDSSCDYIRQMINKLAEYEDLEEQGKLLKPMCFSGDYVWEINAERGIISKYEVTSIRYETNKLFHYMWRLREGIYKNLDGFWEWQIGKTVFLTREQAELALMGNERMIATGQSHEWQKQLMQKFCKIN
ncbi:MAG: hypothetical protein NC118_10950 [Eubacterium sp.]|nr:hypothetical protein [Eubacterium sp.]